MNERRFTEQDVSEILRSASAIQSSDSGGALDGVGLTLPEIQRIGKEVGIDPSHVANAASQLASWTQPKQGFKIVGATRRIVRERIIEASLDDAAWEEMVTQLRDGFESAGTMAGVGTAREWSGSSHGTSIVLSATAKESRARVWVALDQTEAIAVSWLLAIVAAFVASLAVGITLGMAYGGVLALIGMLMTVGAIAAITNRALAGWQARNIERLDSTLDRVEAAGCQAMQAPSVESGERTATASPLSV